MNQADLGYDPESGVHCPSLTTYESTFLGILWVDHVGQDNRISADVLAVIFFFTLSGMTVDLENIADIAEDVASANPGKMGRWKREVRTLHNHLLIKHPNIPILSAAGCYGGYWVAETEDEAKRFYHTFRQRGMTGLIKASRGKRAVLADIVQQLTFKFEDLAGEIQDVPESAGMSAPIEVVDALLEKMTRDPERFAGELRRLGEKFGSVLLPREQVRAMMAKAAELQQLVSSIGLG